MNGESAGISNEEQRESAEEAELIARIRSGESHLYGTLVDRYQRRLWWSCLRMLGDADEADDVVQETFVRAWEKLDGFDPGRRFYTWLFTIARNRCLNALRRRRTWGFRSLSGDDPPVLPAREDAASGVEDRELARALAECLETLPADQREVFDLRHAEDFRYAEIAAVLELTLGTVMSRLHRARERMRDCLEGKGQRP
jgi:RNA polymerase sigma-70 factor (ECF subfamily)